MKNILLISFALLVLSISSFAKGELVKIKSNTYQEDTVGQSVLDSIVSLSLNNYINKPVDSLLNVLPTSSNTKKIMDGGKSYHAERLMVNYSNKYIVYIIVRNFQHMDKFDLNRQWNINLFRKELISWVVVYNIETCVYGCGTINSWD